MDSGLYLGNDVPFSCCHVYSIKPCIHRNVSKGTRTKYKPTLYTQGCADTLVEFFENSILEPSGFFILIAFFLQVRICLNDTKLDLIIINNQVLNACMFILLKVLDDIEVYCRTC